MNDLNERTDSTPPENTSKPLNLSKTVIILAGIVMVLPAVIPLWFAIQAETMQMSLVFGGMSAMLVVVNLLVLYVVHRWLKMF